MSPSAELWCDADLDEALSLETDLGQVALLTRRGPGKEVNEDSTLVAEASGSLLLAVADGMGGHAAGEHASRTALETLAERFPGPRGEDGALGDLVEAIDAANRRVIELRLGAGTTLAVALLRRVEDQLLVRTVHVGDSGLYLVGQRGRLHLRSVSHSLTGYGQEANLLSESEAILHEERHVVLNAVGSEAMRIDVGPEHPVAAKDTLLLCSDGLSDNLWEQEIVDGMRRGELVRSTQRLARQASRRMAESQEGRPSKPDDLSLLLFRQS